MKTVFILSIGDELVLGQSLDTNAAWLADRAAQHGLRTVEHRTVADERGAIAAAVREGAARADLVLATGGLGPTDDDLTRWALLDVVDPGGEAVRDEDSARRLAAIFRKRGRELAEANLVQAMRPAAARMLENPHGTADGLDAVAGDARIVLMPGPPAEMRPMFERFVEPDLAEHGPPMAVEFVHSCGIGESDAAARIGDLTGRAREPLVGTTASHAIVSARIRAHGEDAPARARADADAIADRWSPYAFGRGRETLAEVVGRGLAERGMQLATAESCTGGGIGAMITDVAGSSAWYGGGWITYTNEMKTRELGVREATLREHGAVSAETAREMARGALERSGADLAVAVTGVAGPGGGTEAKPVGTVWIGLAGKGASGDAVRARCFRFRGDREAVRWRTGATALCLIRLVVEGLEAWEPEPVRVPLLRERRESGA